MNFEKTKIAISWPFVGTLQIWLDGIKEELKLHGCTENYYIIYHCKWDIKEKVNILMKNSQNSAIFFFFKDLDGTNCKQS